MTDDDENHATLIYGIRVFFEDELDGLAVEAPALTAMVGEINDHLGEFEKYLATSLDDVTGYAEELEDYRIAMRDSTLPVASGLVAYFKKIKKRSLAKIAKLTQSDVDEARDVAVGAMCQRRVDLVGDYDQAMGGVGLTEDDINAAKACIDTYMSFLERGTIAYKVKYTDIDSASKEVQIMMSKVYLVDDVLETVRFSKSQLFRLWKNVRSINNRRSASGKPVTFAGGVAAGQILVVYTEVYDPDRQIMFENLHPTLSISFGISVIADAFSNPPRILGARKVSVLRCQTLGPNGNFIVFQNTSSEPISIELTVMD